MTKVILLILFPICFLVGNAAYSENTSSHYSAQNNEDIATTNEIRKKTSGSSFWHKVWGKKARDAIHLGMWSIHLDGTGEYFGDGRNNDQGELLGIQYYGLTAGTFINSKDDRAWFFGPAREVYSHQFDHDLRFDAGYKFGLLYGYGDDLMNIGGMSVFAIATFGISWKRVGFDLGILPVGIITGNFRIDIDF